MELTVWPSRWDCASQDPDCLAVLTYIRFSGAPVQVRPHRPNLLAGSRPARLAELPRLRHGTDHRICSEPDRLFAYLRKENYGVEYDFSEESLVRMTTLMRAVRTRLAPAVAQLWWLDSRVYTRVTRLAFADAVRLPMSLVYPSVRHHATRRRLLDAFGYDLDRLDEDVLLKQVTTDGVNCIQRLALTLGQSRYFVLDASPCCLDALVFGYLWPMIKAPLSAATLGSGEPPALLRELKRHPNLLDFCQRIQRAYFPELSGSLTSVDAISSAAGDNAAAKMSEERAAALRNAGLFIALTGLVFSVYAWQAGWIVVQS